MKANLKMLPESDGFIYNLINMLMAFVRSLESKSTGLVLCMLEHQFVSCMTIVFMQYVGGEEVKSQVNKLSRLIGNE